MATTTPFTKAEFKNLEEIGFRLKAYRLSQPHDMQNIAKITRDSQMITNQSYARVEEGGGSLDAVYHALQVFKLTVNIEAEYKGGTTTLTLQDIHEYIKSALIDPMVQPGDIAQKIGAPHASVSTFKKSKATRLNTIQRYADALGIKFFIKIINEKNEPVIPSNILVKAKFDALVSSFNILNKNSEDSRYSDSKLGSDIRKLRERRKLSKSAIADMSHLTESSVAKVENNRALLSSSEKVIDALGKKLIIIIDGQDIEPQDVPSVLDKIRQDRNITISDFARTIGTTYRAVKVFATSEATIASINRYTTGLKVKMSHRFDNIDWFLK